MNSNIVLQQNNAKRQRSRGAKPVYLQKAAMNAAGAQYNSITPGNTENYPNAGLPSKTNPSGLAHAGPSDSMGSMGSIASGQITAKFGGGSMSNTQGRGSLAVGPGAGSGQPTLNQDGLAYNFNAIGTNEGVYVQANNPVYGSDLNYAYDRQGLPENPNGQPQRPISSQQMRNQQLAQQQRGNQTGNQGPRQASYGSQNGAQGNDSASARGATNNAQGLGKQVRSSKAAGANKSVRFPSQTSKQKPQPNFEDVVLQNLRAAKGKTVRLGNPQAQPSQGANPAPIYQQRQSDPRGNWQMPQQMRPSNPAQVSNMRPASQEGRMYPGINSDLQDVQSRGQQPGSESKQPYQGQSAYASQPNDHLETFGDVGGYMNMQNQQQLLQQYKSTRDPAQQAELYDFFQQFQNQQSDQKRPQRDSRETFEEIYEIQKYPVEQQRVLWDQKNNSGPAPMQQLQGNPQGLMPQMNPGQQELYGDNMPQNFSGSKATGPQNNLNEYFSQNNQSSNPRFDLPRQTQTPSPGQFQGQSADPSQNRQELQKGLDQFYKQKHQQNQQKPALDSNLQQPIDFHNPAQQYQSASQPNDQNEDQAAIDLPQQRYRSQAMQNSELAEKEGLGASSSSDNSDKNIEKQLMDMKKDVNMLFQQMGVQNRNGNAQQTQKSPTEPALTPSKSPDSSNKRRRSQEGRISGPYQAPRAGNKQRSQNRQANQTKEAEEADSRQLGYDQPNERESFGPEYGPAVVDSSAQKSPNAYKSTRWRPQNYASAHLGSEQPEKAPDQIFGPTSGRDSREEQYIAKQSPRSAIGGLEPTEATLRGNRQAPGTLVAALKPTQMKDEASNRQIEVKDGTGPQTENQDQNLPSTNDKVRAQIFDNRNSTPRRQLHNRFADIGGVSSTATAANNGIQDSPRGFARNTAEAIARHDSIGLDAPIEDKEFNNLNIARNQSDKDEQQRIFQFSPLSSKKQLDDGESEESEQSSPGGAPNAHANQSRDGSHQMSRMVNILGEEILSEDIEGSSRQDDGRNSSSKQDNRNNASIHQGTLMGINQIRKLPLSTLFYVGLQPTIMKSIPGIISKAFKVHDRSQALLAYPHLFRSSVWDQGLDYSRPGAKTIKEDTKEDGLAPNLMDTWRAGDPTDLKTVSPQPGTTEQRHQPLQSAPFSMHDINPNAQTVNQRNQPLRQQSLDDQDHLRTSENAQNLMITQNSQRQGRNETEHAMIDNSNLFAQNNSQYTVKPMQQDRLTQQQTSIKELRSTECQTDKAIAQEDTQKMQVRNLSPFATYDMLFIRDLVNNLNDDNEVLDDSVNDLKAAFMFLQKEHKQLQFKYQKQKRNEVLVQLYKERVEEITAERDQSLDTGMKLRAKCEYMNDFMKIAVEETHLRQLDTDQMIEQLAAENQELRKLMNIHREQQDQELIEDGVNKPSEEQDSRSKGKGESIDGEEDPVDAEIHQKLLTYEQEVQRTQDDYLMILREESDLQFNREIDEHKEIIQRIYDEKLLEKQDEIEQELQETLTESLTRELTVSLTETIERDLRTEIKEQMTKDLTEKINQKLQSELREEIETDLQSKYEKMFQERIRSQEARQEQLRAMEELKLANKQSSGDGNDQTSQDLQSLLQPMEAVGPQQNVRTSIDSIENGDNIGSNSDQDDQDEFYEDPYSRAGENSGGEMKLRQSSLFQSEKAKFKQDLMMGSTLPPARSKRLEEQGVEEKKEMSPTQNDRRNGMDRQLDDLRRSRQSDKSGKSGNSGTSGTQSDDWSDENLQPNAYNFEQIFDNEALSKEEEELFNQLKAQEEDQQSNDVVDDFNADNGQADFILEETKASSDMQSQNLFNKRSVDRNSMGSNNSFAKKSRNAGQNQRYYKQDDDLLDVLDDGEGQGSSESPNSKLYRAELNALRAAGGGSPEHDNQDEDFQRDPSPYAQLDGPELDAGAGNAPGRGQISPSQAAELSDSPNAESEIQLQQQDAASSSGNGRGGHTQFQGFQGQAINGQQLYQDQSVGVPRGQGQSRGGQLSSLGAGSGAQDSQDQERIPAQSDGAQHSAPLSSGGASPSQQDRARSGAQQVRGQGFQGQGLSGAGSLGQSVESAAERVNQDQPAGSRTENRFDAGPTNANQIDSRGLADHPADQLDDGDDPSSNPRARLDENEIADIDDEYDDFFSGLQREIQSAESQGLTRESMSSIDPASTSNISKQTSPQSAQDLFGDQLTQDLGGSNNTALQLSPSTLEGFLLDEEDEVDAENRRTPRRMTYEDAPIYNEEPDNAGALDSTEGLRGMLEAMAQDERRAQRTGEGSGARMGSKTTQEGAQSLEDLLDQEDNENQLSPADLDDDLVREEAKEEEYDYFLDARRDENQYDNHGYHIVDPADLEISANASGEDKADDAGKEGGDQPAEVDDLEDMQDEELREYRYRHMLEDLRDSIDQEKEDQEEIIARRERAAK